MSEQSITIDSLPLLEQFHDDSIFYVVLNNQDYHISGRQFKDLLVANLPPTPLPEGLVDEQRLERAITGLVTTDALSNAIQQVLQQIPTVPEASTIFTDGNVTQKLGELPVILDLQETLRGLLEKDVYTKEEIGRLFSEFTPNLPADLVTTEQLEEALSGLPQPEPLPEDLVNETRLQQVIQALPQPTPLPEDLVNETRLQEVLQSIPEPTPLPDNLVYVDQLQQALENIPTPEPIPDNLVTEDRLQDVIQALPVPEPLPTGLVDENRLQEVLQAIPQPEALPANLVNEDRLQEVLAALPQSAPLPEDLVNAQQLTEALNGLEIPSIEGLATAQALEQGLQTKLSIPAELAQEAILSLQDGKLVAKATQMGRVYYVNSQSTSTVEDGSLFNPFKTIQKALDTAPSTSVINLAPGTHRGNVVPTKANYLVQGLGCVDSNVVEIVGTTILSGAVVTRFRYKDVQLKNTAVDQPVLVFENNILRHYFNNVSIEPIANTTVAPVQFLGTNSNWVVFFNSNIGGEVLLSGTPAANTTVYFQGAGHTKTHVNVQAAFNVVLQSILQLRGITHSAGNIMLSHVTNFGDIGFVSTAENVLVRKEFVFSRKTDGSFAPYSVSPNATTVSDLCVLPGA